MSASFSSLVFLPASQAPSWDLLPQLVAAKFPGARAELHDLLGEPLYVVTLADGYELGYSRTSDGQAHAAELLDEYPDADVETLETLTDATERPGFVVTVTGDNDMGEARDHFNDFLFAVDILGDLPEAIVVASGELEG